MRVQVPPSVPFNQHIFDNWLGSWQLCRQITNWVSAGLSGQVNGKACFILEDSRQYCYLEQGIFRCKSGLELAICRTYLYSYNVLANCINVYVVDSQSAKFCHALNFDPATSCASAQYRCGKDMYRVFYRLTMISWQLTNMVIAYQVYGPGKNYHFVSSYVRYRG